MYRELNTCIGKKNRKNQMKRILQFNKNKRINFVIKLIVQETLIAFA